MTNLNSNDNKQPDVIAEKHWYSALGNYASNYSSYVMAAIAALLSSIGDIEKRFHVNVFEEIPSLGLSAASKDAAYSQANKEAQGDLKCLVLKRASLYRQFHEDEKLMEQAMGVHNIYDKWKLIMPHQRREIGLKMLTVASLAMGAIFAIKRNKGLAAQVRYHERTKDEAVQEQAMIDARKELEAQQAAVDKLSAQATKAAETGAVEGDSRQFPAVDALAAKVNSRANAHSQASAMALG